MSEKGQKIYKWIVWITLILGVVFAIYSKVDSIINPTITQAEWKALLAESFGDEQILLLDENEKYRISKLDY